MFFGNQQITRADMPSFNWKDADPDFLYQSFQDTLKKSKSATMPMAQPMMSSTNENGANAWQQGGK